MVCMRVISMSWEHVYDKKMRVTCMYGVATISRMLKNIGLFAEYRSLLYCSFAKETCILKHPANRSHPIVWNKWRGCLLYALGVRSSMHVSLYENMCVIYVWYARDSLRYALGVMLSMHVCFWYTLKYVCMLYMRTCVWYMCDMCVMRVWCVCEMCVIRVWCVCEMCVTVCCMFFGMWSRHVCSWDNVKYVCMLYVYDKNMCATCIYIVGKEWQDSLLYVLSIMLSMHVCSWDNVK